MPAPPYPIRVGGADIWYQMRLGDTTVEQSLAPKARGGQARQETWSACILCDGVSEAARVGWKRRVVQSDGPRPSWGQHGGGKPILESIKTSGDDATSGGRTPHRGGPDGVSCARGDRLQVFSSAGELSDRPVDDMKYGLGLGECAPRPPPRRKTSHENERSPWGLTMAAGGMMMKVLSGMRGEGGGGGEEGERSSPGVDSWR
jgi:hypothetical protein